MTRNDIGNPYETDADVEERHHEESTEFDRWLAAHDAQIREDEHVKALKLTDEETSKADEAYWKYTGLGMTKKSMIQNAFKAVGEYREEQKQ